MFETELSAKQLKFLKEFHDGERSVKVLWTDFALTPEEFEGWHRQRAFRRKYRIVMRSLSLVREMEIRKAGTMAAFRYGAWTGGILKLFSIRYRQACKFVIEAARKADPTFPSMHQSFKRNVAPLINPIHPAFRADADRLMDEMEAIRKAAAAGEREPDFDERPVSLD